MKNTAQRNEENFDLNIAYFKQNGFCVIKGVFESSDVIKERERVLSIIQEQKTKESRFVRGSLFLGEENFLSFSKIPSWCMSRLYEFTWNSMPKSTLEIHSKAMFVKKHFDYRDEHFGLGVGEKFYGHYLSTSLYPTNPAGYLIEHFDGHKEDGTIVHYMVPLSNKGSDFSSGGLFIINKSNGKKILIDDEAKMGDLIIFDGTLVHGVDKVLASKDQQMGRLAQFMISTYFEKPNFYSLPLRKIKIFFKELLNRHGLIQLR